MHKTSKAIFYFFTFTFLLPISPDWIVWGKNSPQAISLAFLAYIGMVATLSACAHVLEHLPELVRIQR
jgi:hypothetical protein